MEASPKQQSPGEASIGLGGRMLMAQPDAVLCKLATRGNANAYEVLYGRYHQPVFAFVYHLLARRDGVEDCEDIVQDTFAKAFAGIREKRLDGSFRSWIYTIARNRTFDLIRARKSNVHSLDAETTEIPRAAEHTQTDKHAEQRVELSWLVGAVSELPERQREALLMRELGGLSHTQIASQLGTTVSATKKLIGRGRAAVSEAAVVDGYRPRHLGRDLAMAAPVVPLTLVGLGLGSAAGGAAFAASGAAGGGAAAFGGKAAATVLAVVALGGGAAVVEHNRAADAAAGQQSISAAGPAAANAVEGSQGDADRGSDGGDGDLPLSDPLADDDSRGSDEQRGGDRGDDDRGSDDSRGEGRRDRYELDDEPRPARREQPREEPDDHDRSGSGSGGGGGGGDFAAPEPPDSDDDIREDSGGNSGPGGSGGDSNSGPGSDSLEGPE